jgi:hypothetical protein
MCLVFEHKGGSCYEAKLNISHFRNVNKLASLAAIVNEGLCRAYVCVYIYMFNVKMNCEHKILWDL